MKLQNLFDEMAKDPKIISRYMEIDKHEAEKENPSVSNHVRRVINNCEKAASQLKLGDEFIAGSKITALLHEISGDSPLEKRVEATNTWVTDYMKDKDIDKTELDYILRAITSKYIYRHPGPKYETILKFAKLIDVSRDFPKGFKCSNIYYGKKTEFVVPLNIKDIQFEIEGIKLMVNFITDGKFGSNAANDHVTKRVAIAMSELSKQYSLFNNEVTMDNEYEMTYFAGNGMERQSPAISATYKRIKKNTTKEHVQDKMTRSDIRNDKALARAESNTVTPKKLSLLERIGHKRVKKEKEIEVKY